MSYALIYFAEFDGFNGAGHRVEFHKKDYSGGSTEIICGGGAVRQSWAPDEPKAPIKGCVLEGELVNIEGSFPLSNLYSNEDDTFLIKLFTNTDLKFIGYLVQDDCAEILADFTHPLKFSATDNLGLLKDVPLGNKTVDDYSVTITYSSNNTFNIISGTASVQSGDTIIIQTGTIAGSYTVIAADYPTSNSVQVTPDILFFAGSENVDINVTRIEILLGRYTLADIIKYCLHPTNLLLNCNVYSQLIPVGYTVGRWLEDTIIDSNTFDTGDSFQDCNAVLETILKRFRASLLQVNGVWNIIRWDELRYYNNALPGYEYDSDMVYVQDIVLDSEITIGTGSDIETGIISSILRPFKVVKETFMYKQPSNLLRNSDFKNLGPLITSYVVGSDTYYEYQMPDWEQAYEWTSGGNGYIQSAADRFIRIIYNSYNEEIDRYGVVSGPTGFSNPSAIQGFPIEVNIGDRIRYGFSFKTSDSKAGPWVSIFNINLKVSLTATPRPSNTRYLNAQGQWLPYGTYGGSVPGIPGAASLWYLYHQTTDGGNTNEWQSVQVESEPIPFNGLLIIKLAQASVALDESHYKNIQLEVFNFSSDKIGQTHTESQPPVINNRQDEEIQVDDSPGNVIAGTLFLETFTDPLQDRTNLWQRAIGFSETYRLGQISTFDELIYRSVPRTKLEGNILSLLNPLNVIKYNPDTDKNFIFGMCDNDTKYGYTNGTLWELYDDTEADTFSQDYKFNYLYQKK